VVYGIRPEHFVIGDDGAEAEVQVVEPTGSEADKQQGAALKRERTLDKAKIKGLWTTLGPIS
jgi:hypothetical protein